ncbi:hypothetical protein FACS1894130_12410 [Spirochaetia bacterium]|nr:hypothetical protein FACS1894130_12410 [Spirochaetia bacterium]
MVAQAYDGREAATILDRNEIDVVFTDITMPLMDGIALLKYTACNHKHIIIVLLTGYAEFEYAKSAVTYNAYEYLLKPLDENMLIPLLGKLERHIAKNFYDKQYT